MNWPTAQDFNEAIRNLAATCSDPDLRTGQVIVGTTGVPLPRSGDAADVYQVRDTNGRDWAVKCFTRPVVGLDRRYEKIQDALDRAGLRFTVGFTFLNEGILVRGRWFPAIKMEWVDGLLLNQAARDHAGNPKVLDALGRSWSKLCKRLREAGIAHADIQHGNVLLATGAEPGSYGLKLIDYDGMYVPALANSPSGESGDPNYQHPLRAVQKVYSPDLDRFPHLVVATALKALSSIGPSLWERYDTGDNLLFTEGDFRTPASSRLMKELWYSNDVGLQTLVGHLAIACGKPIPRTPWLDQIAPDGHVNPLDVELVPEVLDALGIPNPSLAPIEPVNASAYGMEEPIPVETAPIVPVSASAYGMEEPIPVEAAPPPAPAMVGAFSSLKAEHTGEPLELPEENESTDENESDSSRTSPIVPIAIVACLVLAIGVAGVVGWSLFGKKPTGTVVRNKTVEQTAKLPRREPSKATPRMEKIDTPIPKQKDDDIPIPKQKDDDIPIPKQKVDDAPTPKKKEVDPPIVVKKEPPKREAVPEAAAIKMAREKLHEELKSEFAKTNVAERKRLAAKLLASERELADPTVKPSAEARALRFALCLEARTIFADVFETELALQVIARLVEVFEVDPVESRLALFQEITNSPKLNNSARTQVAELALEASDARLAIDDFPGAQRFAQAAKEAASSVKSRELIKEADDQLIVVTKGRRDFEDVEPALERLKLDPDNFRACYDAGRYYCFRCGNWEAGLKLLAQGATGPLRSAARLDVMAPREGPADVKLAEAWWQVAQDANLRDRPALRYRARYWYARALPGLMGIARIEAEERLGFQGEDGVEYRVGLIAEYNKSPKLTRIEPGLSFDAAEFKPATRGGVDAKWSGFLIPPRPGRYRIVVAPTNPDDFKFVTIKVDDKIVRFDDFGSGRKAVVIFFQNRPTPITVSMKCANADGHGLKLSWCLPGTDAAMPIPPEVLYHRKKDAAAGQRP